MTAAPKIVEGQENVEAEGFAFWNRNPHLLVEVPDGGFTATFRTSQGKRVTVAFVSYESGGPPQCADVAYHDSGETKNNGGRDLPTFDVLAFSTGRTPYDSRKGDTDRKPTCVCILMEDDPKREVDLVANAK